VEYGVEGSGGAVYGYQEPPLPIPTRAELEAAGIRIAVAVPMERNVTDWAFMHFWQIAQRGWPLISGVYGRTDVNRNRIGRFVRETPEITHVVMLDLDHLHAGNIVERLASWVLEDRERLVVSGLHFRRSEPFDPLAFVYGPDGKLHPPVEWPRGLMEAHAVGHGSILIAREVFERLPQPWWAYSYDEAREDVFPSEDMWFSRLCLAHGIRIWVDTTVTSPHLVTNLVDEDTFRRWLADNMERITLVDDRQAAQAAPAAVEV